MFSRLALFTALFLNVAAVNACPFCASSGKTFSDEVKQAQLILFGTMENAQKDPKEFGKGTTDLKIEVLIKDDNFIKDKKVITLPRYIQSDPKNPTKYLVFCEVYKGEIDPYRGIAVDPKSKMAEYLQGAQKVIDKDAATRMEYYFKYLDCNEVDIANDALMEFGNVDYKDMQAVAKKFPPKLIAGWLADENTPSSRLGLYGSLLGHCGNAKEHAPLLRKILDDPKKRALTGVDGIIAGYLMLDPKEGEKYIQGLFRDQKEEALGTNMFPGAAAILWENAKTPPREEFLARYAGLRALRFFWSYRDDVLSKDKIVSLMTPLLYQEDITDLAMDDFRKWHRWEYTDTILHLYQYDQFKEGIVKRAIIRYALCATSSLAAKDFVKARRAEDNELVQSVEELLDQTKEAPAVAKP